MALMQVNKFVESDLSFVTSIKRYDDKYDFMRISYSFAENVYVMQKCTEAGIIITDSWDATCSYGACRLDGDIIMFINEKYGWIRDEVATEKWANILAERELLK